MPVRDFHEMREFYRLFPFDDFHRFHRPAALVANAMSSAKTEELLRWLQPDPSEEGWAEARPQHVRRIRRETSIEGADPMAAGSIIIDLLMRTGSFETDTKWPRRACAKWRR